MIHINGVVEHPWYFCIGTKIQMACMAENCWSKVIMGWKGWHMSKILRRVCGDCWIIDKRHMPQVVRVNVSNTQLHIPRGLTLCSHTVSLLAVFY